MSRCLLLPAQAEPQEVELLPQGTRPEDVLQQGKVYQAYVPGGARLYWQETTLQAWQHNPLATSLVRTQVSGDAILVLQHTASEGMVLQIPELEAYLERRLQRLVGRHLPGSSSSTGRGVRLMGGSASAAGGAGSGSGHHGRRHSQGGSPRSGGGGGGSQAPAWLQGQQQQQQQQQQQDMLHRLLRRTGTEAGAVAAAAPTAATQRAAGSEEAAMAAGPATPERQAGAPGMDRQVAPAPFNQQHRRQQLAPPVRVGQQYQQRQHEAQHDVRIFECEPRQQLLWSIAGRATSLSWQQQQPPPPPQPPPPQQGGGDLPGRTECASVAAAPEAAPPVAAAATTAGVASPLHRPGAAAAAGAVGPLGAPPASPRLGPAGPVQLLPPPPLPPLAAAPAPDSSSNSSSCCPAAAAAELPAGAAAAVPHAAPPTSSAAAAAPPSSAAAAALAAGACVAPLGPLPAKQQQRSCTGSHAEPPLWADLQPEMLALVLQHAGHSCGTARTASQVCRSWRRGIGEERGALQHLRFTRLELLPPSTTSTRDDSGCSNGGGGSDGDVDGGGCGSRVPALMPPPPRSLAAAAAAAPKRQAAHSCTQLPWLMRQAIKAGNVAATVAAARYLEQQLLVPPGRGTARHGTSGASDGATWAAPERHLRMPAPAAAAVVDVARCWARAAKQGHPEAQWKLGYWHYKGLMGQARDAEEALLWLSRAAKQLEEVTAALPLPPLLPAQAAPGGAAGRASSAAGASSSAGSSGDGESGSLARPALMSAATCWHILAQAAHILGYLFLDGEGTRADTAAAIRWFRVSERAGCRDAGRVLGSLYNTGQFA